MHKFIQFDIQAIDNLKLGKFERDSNNWYSHSYIPGSVIKGAIVWNIVNKKGIADNKVLNGDTIFYNAYPMIDGQVTIPLMQGYVGNKQNILSRKEEVHLYHSFDVTNYEDSIPFNSYEFMLFEKDSKHVKGYNPTKVENLHINKKDAGKDNKTQIFRYEAIEKGECFRGYIKVNQELSDEIYSVLDKKVIYFGGARGSGYGRCEISNIKYVPFISLIDSDTDIQDDLYIYFLSDAILYYNGKVSANLPPEVLKEKLDIKGECKFISSFINLNKAATYNTMYHTNTVCYTSVAKGSIMKYKVNEKINPEKIRQLALSGLGIRKEDGYGQIAIFSKIPDKLAVTEYVKNKSFYNKNIILNDEDKKLINNILKDIFYQRARLQTERLVISLLIGKRKPDYNVQTQIGKILNLFQNSIFKSEVNFKEELSKYLDHMREKRGKEVWHKLNRLVLSCKNREFIVEPISIQKLLLDFTNSKDNSVFEIFNQLSEKGIELGEFKYPEDTNLTDVIYHLQHRFFVSLFEQFIRIKR
ncbi:MAG: CRISPR-associated protein [Clostridiales bacterium]|nr:CRISPR-associated protein [Clostridiales bacterium]